MIGEIEQLLAPLLYLAGFALAGYVIRIVLKEYLSKYARKTQLDGIIIEAIGFPLFLAFLVAGITFALAQLAFIPAETKQYLPTIRSVVITIIAAVGTVRVIAGILKHYEQTRPNIKSLAEIFSKILRALVYFVAFILILYYLGINITAFVAGLGIGGIAIAFALQETLSHFFAGVYIMTDKPVRLGDYVELESGQAGYVEDINWRSVRIRELSDNIIIVPNSKLAGMIVRNYSMPGNETLCSVQVGVSYDSDLEKVERITIEVAKNTMKKLGIEIPGFEPFVRYHTFGESSINFNVVLKVREFSERGPLIHEFIKELHRRYREEGIEIPFPIRTIYIKSGALQTAT